MEISFRTNTMKKVLTGGGFDLIHSAHIYLFQISKSFGDYLVVNILPDQRMKELKGNSRPVLSEKERAYIVKNIRGVDEVVCIHQRIKDIDKDDYNIQVISEVSPAVVIMSTYSKGIDDFCKSKNIEFIVVPEIQGIDKVHSTDIINKMTKL